MTTASRTDTPSPTESRRQRRTVLIDAARLDRWLERAASLASSDAATASAQPLASVGEVALDAERALLKAFIEHAQPAGGLRLDAGGRPRDLHAIVARGLELHREGDVVPKLMQRIRAGHAVDQRLAEAVLQYVRFAVRDPALNLEDLGAEPSWARTPLAAMQARVRAACEALPRGVLDAVWNRVSEASRVATVIDRPEYTYLGFTSFTDARGCRRVRLQRVMTKRPARLTETRGTFRPRLTYEGHEWHRYESATLTLRRVTPAGRVTATASPPVRKRFDPARGVVVFDLTPDDAAGCAPLLDLPALGDARDFLEVAWTETMVMNPLDRDIVVSYLPMIEPRIRFDAQAHPGVRVQVGDSPGLVREASGWRLDRVLPPREVLAVRIAMVDAAAVDPRRIGPAGEWWDGPRAA